MIDYISEFTADNKNKRPICHANISMIHHKIRPHQYGACVTFVVDGHALTTLLQNNSDYFITLICRVLTCSVQIHKEQNHIHMLFCKLHIYLK